MIEITLRPPLVASLSFLGVAVGAARDLVDRAVRQVFVGPLLTMEVLLCAALCCSPSVSRSSPRTP